MNNSKPKSHPQGGLFTLERKYRKSVRSLLLASPCPSKMILRSFNTVKKYPSWKQIWNISIHEEEFELVVSNFRVEFQITVA